MTARLRSFIILSLGFFIIAGVFSALILLDSNIAGAQKKQSMQPPSPPAEESADKDRDNKDQKGQESDKDEEKKPAEKKPKQGKQEKQNATQQQTRRDSQKADEDGSEFPKITIDVDFSSPLKDLQGVVKVRVRFSESGRLELALRSPGLIIPTVIGRMRQEKSDKSLWGIEWDTTQHPNGSYTLLIIAYNDKGEVATASNFSIRIDNKLEEISKKDKKESEIIKEVAEEVVEESQDIFEEVADEDDLSQEILKNSEIAEKIKKALEKKGLPSRPNSAEAFLELKEETQRIEQEKDREKENKQREKDEGDTRVEREADKTRKDIEKDINKKLREDREDELKQEQQEQMDQEEQEDQKDRGQLNREELTLLKLARLLKKLENEFDITMLPEEKIALEEPLDVPEPSPNLLGVEGVSLVAIPTEDDTEPTEEGLLIHGYGPPESWLTLYIYSELPVVVSVRTDANGKWSYILDKPIKDGPHKVYVTLAYVALPDSGAVENTESSQQIKERSSAFSFVKTAEAVSVIQDSQVEQKAPAIKQPVREQSLEMFALKTITVIITALLGAFMVVVYIVRRYKKPSTKKQL